MFFNCAIKCIVYIINACMCMSNILIPAVVICVRVISHGFGFVMVTQAWFVGATICVQPGCCSVTFYGVMRAIKTWSTVVFNHLFTLFCD